MLVWLTQTLNQTSLIITLDTQLT